MKLHPNCEICDKDLPPNAPDAMICGYECTFCRACVETLMQNVCPKCGGGLEKRPIRPKTARRPGVSLAHQPASTIRVHTRYTRKEIEDFAEEHKDVPVEDR